MKWSVLDFTPWQCPKCHRVMFIFADRTRVLCRSQNRLWHDDLVECYRIPDDEGDPLALARVCGLVP